MSENVVYLHGRPEPVGHFLRIGSSGHRQLEVLVGAGRMPIDRFVVDASAVTRQSDLLTSLSERGAELVLDTNVAELSSVGRFAGSASSAPWANPDSILTVEDLKANSNRDVIGQIARFAVLHNFHAVQSPAHVLEGSTDPLFLADQSSTIALRKALDAEGGRHIGIDYPLMIKTSSLRDPAQRRAFIAVLTDSPFENLWLRISGFGSDATAVGLRRYIAAALDFQRVGRPIVADNVGGLVGLAIAAFGAAGGVSHGVAEKERFDTSSWGKPPTGSGGGKERRILLNRLDRLLSVKQVEALMAAQGARTLLSCHDTSCCPNGLSDTLKNPKAHYLRQRAEQFRLISAVPENRRATHFISKNVADAERSSRDAAKLRVKDEGLAELLRRARSRLEKMGPVLGDLSATIQGQGRAHAPLRRADRSSKANSGRHG